MAFLNTSLDKLVKLTPQDKFTILSEKFPNTRQRDLVCRKGIYPYEYMDNFGKFDEITLPPKEAFHSSLSNSVSSEALHAYGCDFCVPMYYRACYVSVKHTHFRTSHITCTFLLCVL